MAASLTFDVHFHASDEGDTEDEICLSDLLNVYSNTYGIITFFINQWNSEAKILPFHFLVTNIPLHPPTTTAFSPLLHYW
jgi:hypothetical protein